MKRKSRPAHSLSPMKIALYAIGGYALYALFKSGANAATPASAAPGASSVDVAGWNAIAEAGGLTAPVITMTAPAPLPGASAPSAAQLGSASTFWAQLVTADPPVSGYINFPSGSQAPAALFGYGNTARDASGNTYVQWAGGVYQLTGPDANGNYPTSQVA